MIRTLSKFDVPFRPLGATVSICVALCFALVSSDVTADSSDIQLVDGLRQRQLFDVAEAFCKQQLYRADLSQVDQALLTNAWLKTVSAKAISRPAAQRKPIWDHAAQIATDFETRFPGHPRGLLIQTQAGLVLLAEGEMLRRELEAGMQSANAKDQALAALRASVEQLTKIDRFLDTEIPIRFRDKVDPPALSAEQLLSLQNNVRFQIARSHRNRALLYDSNDRLNRVDALTRVLEQYDAIDQRVSAEDPLSWEVKIDRVKCWRSIGQLGKAKLALDNIPTEGAGPTLLLTTRALAVELALAENDVTKAGQLARVPAELAQYRVPDFDFAVVKVYLALAKSNAGLPSESTRWQTAAIRLAESIEQKHGVYWGRRAHRLIVGGVDQKGVQDLNLLIRIANQAYAQGRLDEAVDAFDQAVINAKEQGRDEKWFELGYQAGLIQHKQGNTLDAAKRLRVIAMMHSENPKAPNAHLLAAWYLSQQASDDSSLLDLYVSLLQENIATWPQGDSSDQARVWLGKILHFRRQFKEAVTHFINVSSESEQFRTAAAGAVRSANSLVQESQRASAVAEQLARSLSATFQAKIANHLNNATMNSGDRILANGVAQLLLTHTSHGYVAAERLLSQALSNAPTNESAWRQKANLLLVMALAGQPTKIEAAKDLVVKLAASSGEDVLSLIKQLDSISNSVATTQQVAVAQLIGLVYQEVRSSRSQWTSQQKIQIDVIRFRAWARSGNVAEAARRFEQFSKLNSKVGFVQENYAEFLSELPRGEFGPIALEQWRRVALGRKPRTESWFRAKYNVALLLFEMNQKKQAEQMLMYLKETPPGWGQSSLNADFEKLLKRSGS